MSHTQTGSARRDAISLFSFVVELSISQMNDCYSLWEMWASKSDQSLVSDVAVLGKGEICSSVDDNNTRLIVLFNMNKITTVGR